MFDRGIDAMGSLVDAAESAGVVNRKGAWYYFGEKKLGQVRGSVLEASDFSLTG